MSTTSAGGARRPTSIPRPGRDPITAPARALAVIGLAADRPRRPETIALLLDDGWRGLGVLVATGASEPLHELVDVAAAAEAHHLVVASIRRHGGPHPGDADRWLDALAAAEGRALHLVEWFVTGRGGLHCPRDLVGMAPRWPGRADQSSALSR